MFSAWIEQADFAVFFIRLIVTKKYITWLKPGPKTPKKKRLI